MFDDDDDLEGPEDQDNEDHEDEEDDDLKDSGDTGDQDDDGGDDEDLEGPPEGGQPRKQLTRGQKAIIAARKRAQKAEERAARAEEAAARNSGQIDVLSRQMFSGNTEQQRREEEARVAEMDADQRAEYFRNKDRNEHAAMLAQAEFRTMDRIDKSDFRMLCRENKAFASVEKEVETELQKLRSNGKNVDRETIAKLILGDRAANRSKNSDTGRGRDRDDKGGKQRRAPRSGSDATAPRGGDTRRKGSTPAERLEGKKF